MFHLPSVANQPLPSSLRRQGAEVPRIAHKCCFQNGHGLGQPCMTFLGQTSPGTSRGSLALFLRVLVLLLTEYMSSSLSELWLELPWSSSPISLQHHAHWRLGVSLASELCSSFGMGEPGRRRLLSLHRKSRLLWLVVASGTNLSVTRKVLVMSSF